MTDGRRWPNSREREPEVPLELQTVHLWESVFVGLALYFHCLVSHLLSWQAFKVFQVGYWITVSDGLEVFDPIFWLDVQMADDKSPHFL